jgi:MFS family permease
MFLTFGVEAVLVFLVTKIAGAPIAFLVLFSFIFLFWGEIYSLFSATTGDVFGPKNASANYGMVYTAKGAASVFAGFGAAALAAYFGGSFAVPFYISAVLCAIAALCSIFILRPLLRSRIAKEVRAADGKALSAALAQASWSWALHSLRAWRRTNLRQPYRQIPQRNNPRIRTCSRSTNWSRLLRRRSRKAFWARDSAHC